MKGPADQVNFRLRTDLTVFQGRNGYPQFEHFVVIDTTKIQHFVVTHASGQDRLFIDGVEFASFDRPTDFSDWDETFPLCVGNECLPNPTEEDLRRFQGDIHLIAIYDKALSFQEVQQNFSAGPDPEL